MRVWLKRSAWAAGALVLVWLIGWLALPPLLLWQLPPRLSEALGRPVSIGALSLKPWTLEVTAGDLVIGGSAGTSEPFLQIAKVHADLSISSLVRRVPVIEALEIDAPRVRIARTADGRYDIDDLLTRFAPDPNSPPTRFALYNVQVRDAQVRFDDRPVSRVHVVDALQLTLPFMSNLPAEVEIKVEPRLAFRLNGTAFDTGAQATPFAVNKAGAMKIAMSDLDIAPYLAYVPASLPVRATRGKLSTDLDLQFAVPQNGTPSLSLKGTVAAKDLALADAGGQPLADWRELKLALADLQPLARRAAVTSLRIDGTRVLATRDAAGHINLLRLMPATTSPQSASGAPATATARTGASAASSAVPAANVGAGTVGPIASAASADRAAAAARTSPRAASGSVAGAAPAPTVTPAAGTEWNVRVDTLELTDARVLWTDAAVHPAAALQLDGLTISARDLQWPRVAPVPLAIRGTLRAQADNAPPLAEFTVDGPLTDRVATLAVTLKGVALGAAAPYLAPFLRPTITGRLEMQAKVDWSSAPDAQRLRLAIEHLTVDAFTLREEQGRTAQDAVALQQLAVDEVEVDALARTISLGSVRLAKPTVELARAKDGHLNVATWTAPESASATPAPGTERDRATASGPAPKAKPPERHEANASATARWQIRLKEVAIDGGSVRWSDAMAGRAREPVRVVLSDLKLAVHGIEWQDGGSAAAGKVELSARVGGQTRDRTAPAGSVRYDGRLGTDPLVVNGRLRVERFPVHLFAPYFADQVRLSLLRAEAGYSGTVALRQSAAGPEVSAAGDVLLGDVHVATLPNAAVRATTDNTDELVSWQALSLKGLNVALKPKQRPRIEIGEADLNDFYSRLVITEEGRFNIRDVVGDAPTDVAAAPASSASAVAAAPASTSAGTARQPSTSGGMVTASVPATGSSELPVDIVIGATRLTNGRVDFRDRFVRPNYSAALTELNGRIGRFASNSREMASIEMRGRAEGTALLDIRGQLNPLARPLALDIQAKATDLELAPLSPYAGKYAGYAIERGKLSMDVAYKIDADGKLDARNQVVLNQLTFGDKIESKDATKLPVRLAVALLKDRNGVIDVNLPISGSINDPQFSVGGLIFKVIVNLLTKALTAPFALLSGGHDDISLVEFEPGTAVLTPKGTTAIEQVAKALTDRPALKMTVTGAADPVSEREALQRAAIDARLRSEGRRDSLRTGAPTTAASASAASAAPVAQEPAPLNADERNRLLEQVYKNTDLPDKPRNALGFAKSIPGPEMEALLKSRVVVTTESARELALQRGIAVRDALIAKGLGNERLFLAAPKLRAAGEEGAAWTPRVQLSLSTN